MCEHKWVHLETIRNEIFTPGYSNEFKRVDIYYCEKCLEQKEIELTQYARCASEVSWY